MENLEFKILGYLNQSAKGKSNKKSSTQIAKAIGTSTSINFISEVNKTLLFMSYSDLFGISEVNNGQKTYYFCKSNGSQGITLFKQFE